MKTVTLTADDMSVIRLVARPGESTIDTIRRAVGTLPTPDAEEWSAMVAGWRRSIAAEKNRCDSYNGSWTDHKPENVSLDEIQQALTDNVASAAKSGRYESIKPATDALARFCELRKKFS